ncbi:conserved hypothetical protein, secreted [Candidatus Magnetomorum sp. HK-1]|nr:conserved hypothetical protein, secreted [Candidatus Magnetomorum sp. HK-1]
MKKIITFSFSVSTLLFIACIAIAYSEGISIDPECPGPKDRIKLLIDIDLPTPCNDVRVTKNINGNNITIYINLIKSNEMCIQVIDRRKLTVDLGILRIGKYYVKVYRDYWSSVELDSFSFNVGQCHNDIPLIISVSPSLLTVGTTDQWIYIYGKNFSRLISGYPKVWIAGVKLTGAESTGAAPATYISSTKIKVHATFIYEGSDNTRDIAVRYNSGINDKIEKTNMITVSFDENGESTECKYTQSEFEKAISSYESLIVEKNNLINELNSKILTMYTKDQIDQAIRHVLDWGDYNNDGKVGLVEAINALQISSGIKKNTK